MMANTSIEACQHAAVDKRDYHVTVRHTMSGDIVMEATFEAGSRNHAALMMGMELLSAILLEGGMGEDDLHNIEDHVIVDVQLAL